MLASIAQADRVKPWRLPACPSTLADELGVHPGRPSRLEAAIVAQTMR